MYIMSVVAGISALILIIRGLKMNAHWLCIIGCVLAFACGYLWP